MLKFDLRTVTWSIGLALLGALAFYLGSYLARKAPSADLGQIPLERQELETEPPPPEPRQPQTRPVARDPIKNPATKPKRDWVQKISEDVYLIMREGIQQLPETPADWYKHIENDLWVDQHGKIQGSRILEVTPGMLADQLGWKKGDIITEINREPVTRKTTATKAFWLRNKVVEMSILREGQLIHLTYKLDL